SQRDASGVGKRPVPAIDGRAVLCRHIRGVDDILHSDRQPSEQTRTPIAVGCAGLGQRIVRVEMSPRFDCRALLNAVEMVTNEILRREVARRQAGDSLGGGETIAVAHSRAPNLLSTQSPTSSRRASAWRRPTSWTPTG